MLDKISKLNIHHKQRHITQLTATNDGRYIVALSDEKIIVWHRKSGCKMIKYKVNMNSD